MTRFWTIEDREIATPSEWPCPYCGADVVYDQAYLRRGPKALRPTVCTECGVLFNTVWVDGAWMGRWVQAGRPGSLVGFVKETKDAQ